jgi:hypothetical protein
MIATPARATYQSLYYSVGLDASAVGFLVWQVELHVKDK